ncbi:MAG: hypothetical protein AAFX01_01675 [Cyanobacteria bacterium J06638_28]
MLALADRTGIVEATLAPLSPYPPIFMWRHRLTALTMVTMLSAVLRVSVVPKLDQLVTMPPQSDRPTVVLGSAVQSLFLTQQRYLQAIAAKQVKSSTQRG